MSILFGIVVVIKRSEPFVKFGIKLIFVCVVRIVEYFIMPSVLKSYEGKTWVIPVFLWNCQEMCSQKIPKILDRQESGSVVSQPS